MSLRRIVKTRFDAGPTVLAAVAALEFALGCMFYLRPQLAFALLGRPVVDPVIARQYGMFLVSVALMYAIAASDPIAFRRLLWIGVAQRAAEFAVAVIDWGTGALPTASFALIAVAEAGLAGILIAFAAGREAKRTESVVRTRSDIWLARTLAAFGGLQLFWAVLSTIFVQFGARLLGWKLQDAYTTQQQGIALLVIGLTSLLAASDVRRYHRLIWVPVASQAFGVANAVNELRLGTISPTVALVQWAIEASLIAALLSLAPAKEREPERAVALKLLT